MAKKLARMTCRVFGLMLVASFLFAADEPSQTTFREGFESAKVSWRREQSDASVTIQEHDRSTKAAHEGRTSEHLAFRAGAGSVLYYSLNVPKVAISDTARGSIYIRANRPGAQVFGRVVLPGDLDPDTGRASFVLVPGESLKSADRWEKLELADLRAGLAREARVLRLGSNRKVSLEGAYLERLVVNLYGGAGENEIFLDEVSVSPIEPPEVAKNEDEPDVLTPPTGPQAVNPHPEAKDTAKIRVAGGQILRDSTDFLPLIIDAQGANLAALRQAGFNVLYLPRGAPARLAEEATRAGLLLMPTLDIGPNIAPETVVAQAEAYPYLDKVAFWNLGDELGRSRDVKARKDEVERIRKVIMGIHDLPIGRPRAVVGTVSEGLPYYALAGRNLDIMGVEAADWATIREPIDTFSFLKQRRDLTALKNAHAPHLAWIEASAPPSASRNIWGLDDPPAWGRPQIQPEQLRFYTYSALAAGYRALGFRADSEITSLAGRPRFLEMALLNAELELVEPILARGTDPIVLWNTFEKDNDQLIVYNGNGAAAGISSQRSNPMTKAQQETGPHPTIKAASIPTADGRGRLLLVSDYAAGGQFQPPQSGFNNLKVLITCPENCQAFEINPASVKVLERERVTGGLRFAIPMFSGSSMILVTTDHGIKSRLEAAVARTAPMASEFAIEQARLNIREASEVNAQLAREGHAIRDADDLIRQAEEHYKSAVEAKERADYSLAWFEARYVGRAMRVLKVQHYYKAVFALNKTTDDLAKLEEKKAPNPWKFPISCPPLTAFQTLPEAFHWIEAIRGGSSSFGENLLPSGDFDDGGLAEMAKLGWSDVGYSMDHVESKIELVQGTGYGATKNSALRLLVAPRVLDQKSVDKMPFFDHEVAAVRTPPIPVVRNQLYRIRVLVRQNRQLPSSTGGLIVRDSLGGEAYQFRVTDFCPLLREVTLYRLAPEDGTMTVTLGLAGYSDAYFDRLRIDTIAKGGASPTKPRVRDDQPIARRPTPPNPNLPANAEVTRPR